MFNLRQKNDQKLFERKVDIIIPDVLINSVGHNKIP